MKKCDNCGEKPCGNVCYNCDSTIELEEGFVCNDGFHYCNEGCLLEDLEQNHNLNTDTYPVE